MRIIVNSDTTITNDPQSGNLVIDGTVYPYADVQIQINTLVKVGDQLHSYDLDGAPPEGSVVLDRDQDVWKRLGGGWIGAEGDLELAALFRYAPLTIIHVP